MISDRIYQAGISVYHAGIGLAAIAGNKKARKWIEGRKEIFRILEEKKIEFQDKKVIWMHCASLGEFEQGRPVLEILREKHPDFFFLLTFFSPSGYEYRKNETLADLVTYLPADTALNAGRFIELVNPQIALFVKYDFWKNYLDVLSSRNIPIVFFSSIFRKEQIFFKPWGRVFKNMLRKVDRFYVQDEKSLELLESIGIEQAEIISDTRFDRVVKIAEEPYSHPGIEDFIDKHPTLVAGSIHLDDLSLLKSLVKPNWRLILAPHDLSEPMMEKIIEKFGPGVCFLSTLRDAAPNDCPVLIIDRIGILAYLYRLADMAYLGGGFGKGIHNTLEAAVYGIPIAFGPRFQKFKEARELIDRGAAISGNERELSQKMLELMEKPEQRKKMGRMAKTYVLENSGGSIKIAKGIEDMIQ